MAEVDPYIFVASIETTISFSHKQSINMNTAASFRPNVRTENPQWDLTELLIPFPEKTYQKGDLIFRQGQTESNIYFVMKGKVLLFQHDYIFDKEMTLGLFLNGEFINSDILAGDPGTNRYAVAKSVTVIKEIPKLSFFNLLSQHTFLSRLVMKRLVQRQTEIQRRLHNMELMSTRQRILHFLVEYTERAGRAAGYEKVVRNILTHQELGGLCQASRQSVTTVLNDLRQQKIVHFNRRYLLVRDLEKLREMALTDHVNC